MQTAQVGSIIKVKTISNLIRILTYSAMKTRAWDDDPPGCVNTGSSKMQIRRCLLGCIQSRTDNFWEEGVVERAGNCKYSILT